MNIFVTDDSPYNCAANLDDRRVIKMILETAQLLSGAVKHYRPDAALLYAPTHMNHPCAIWARASYNNFEWLVVHGISLNKVYFNAYDRDHKSLEIINRAWGWSYLFPKIEQTPFANCTNYKHLPVIEAYRLQMLDKWEEDDRRPTWKNREPPSWLSILKPINHNQLALRIAHTSA